jgi:putative addiction module killer protein
LRSPERKTRVGLFPAQKIRPPLPSLAGVDRVYLVRYTLSVTVVAVRQTATFARWFKGLRDSEARARILVRIRRLSLGNPGDVRAVGAGVSVLRIVWGGGYRVYFITRAEALVILLAGGDKRTQAADIQAAIELARTV